MSGNAAGLRAGSGPATGVLGPELRPAALGRRVGAYLIDSAIAVAVLLAAAGAFAGISFATQGAFPLLAAGLAAYAVLAGWFVVYTLMQGGAGSIGMRALGLRLGDASDVDGARVGFGRALVRNLIWALGGMIVVGMFSPLFDASAWRRGWHDKASGTVVADVAGRGGAVAGVHPVGRSDVVQLSEEVGAQGVPGMPGEPGMPGMQGMPGVPQVLPPAPILPLAEDTELASWTPAGAAGPAAPARTPVQTAGLISFVPGISDPALLDAPPSAPAPGIPVVDVAPGSVTPGVVTPEVSAPPASALDDPLEQTRLSTGERPIARLVWDDGVRQALYGRTLFGRNPAPETGAMVSPVRDETLSLSKTHFELAPGDVGDDRALWVIDRHSTNGVVIRRGTQRQTAAPGERTRVRMGDVLEFGDRHVTIEVAP